MVALMGTVTNLGMDLDTARHYIERIQEHLTRADYHVNQARKLILDLKERDGWKVLGYGSWRECVTAEFNKSSSTVYRQLSAALVELELSPSGGIGEINERVLRPLTKREYSAEARQAIWAVSQDIVGEGGRVTSGVVEAVIDGLKDMLQSGATQDADGNQHPITEQMQADLVARVRQVKLAHKDHIKRMGKERNYILGGYESRVLLGQLDAGVVGLQISVGNDIELEKLLEARRLGKTIYCSLWTE